MATSSIAPGSSDKIRDWPHLDGLVDLITECVLTTGVVDFFSFRQVCKPWRACSDHLRPQGVLDRRFQPRGWIVLPNTFTDGRSNRRRLMNTFTGKHIYITSPDLHHVIGSTSEGLLLLGRTDTDDNIKLLNPITGQIINNLPPASTLGLGEGSSLCDIELRGAGHDDASTVVLHFSAFSLAIAKPGDERWTRIYDSNNGIFSILSFAGRVYCATGRNISVVADQRPQLEVAADYYLDHTPRGNSTHFLGRSRVYLIENNGELIACHYDCCDRNIHGRCYLYGVNLVAGYTVPLDRLKNFARKKDRLKNGHALFISATRSVLVDCSVSPFICPDTVYLYGPYVLAFDLLGGTCADHKFKKSNKATNYLSSYVSS